MAITACPVTPTFAAEIGDVNLSRKIDPNDLAAIEDAFTKYAVLIFPDQHLSQDQHLDFAGHFGPLETSIAVYRKDAQLRVRQEFADVSNLNHYNEVWGKDSRQRLFQLGNRLWHTDSSFKQLPARASLLYARLIPSIGGHTEFADERAGRCTGEPSSTTCAGSAICSAPPSPTWPTHASSKASPSEPRSEPQPPVEAVSLPRPLFGIEHRWELTSGRQSF